jgi:magnesium-transporting ATPase (P-type)
VRFFVCPAQSSRTSKKEVCNMPQTKTQGAVFGLLMSYFMALGMEVANVAHKLGAMSNAVFLPALKETAFMGAIVFVVSMLYGSRAGQHIAHKFVRQGRDNPLLVTLAVSGCTVMVMCPSMSLIATVLFKEPGFGTWVHTWGCNMPMALCWQMLYCGPLARAIFRLVFRRGEKQAA